MKSLYTLLLLCITTLTLAQTNTKFLSTPNEWGNLTTEAVQASLENNKLLRDVQIQQIAKEKNIPISYISKEGVSYEFVDYYPDGTPIYYQTFNANAANSSNRNAIKADLGIDLTGKGVLVGLFDTATLYNQHVEFTKFSNIEIKSQIPNNSGSLSDRRSYLFLQEHSTHVGGTIKAYGVDARAKGLANEASLWSYSWTNDISDMFKGAKAGMLVSNHSYGVTLVNDRDQLTVNEKIVGVYGTKATEVDYISYSFPYYQPVLAAGNYQEKSSIIHPGGAGYNNLSGFTTAKNVIVVGAADGTKMGRERDKLAVASFSSYGPTKDFRIKPDILAEGVGIYSSIPDYLQYDGYVLKNNRYRHESGTSMATPVVTSVLALWQEWAISHYNVALLSSSIRALLAHSAYVSPTLQQMNADKSKGPNAAYGWGLIDAKKGISILEGTKTGLTYIIESDLKESEIKNYIIDNLASDNEIEVTIAWTDPQSWFDYNYGINEKYHDALVNDLDVRFVTDNKIYFPWALTKNMNNPVAKQMDNNVDNLEKIATAKLPVGKSNIVLSHKKVLSGGNQKFSLIITTKEPINVRYVTNLFEEDQSSKEDENGALSFIKTETKHEKEGVTIYPNPVQETLNMLPTNKEEIILSTEVFSINGELKMTNRSVNNNSIEVSGLAKGFYVIRITTNLGESSKFFVKK